MHSLTENHRAWVAGVERGVIAYSRLGAPCLETLASLAGRLMAAKVEMQSLVEQVDASAHCAACRGACCAAGRFHFRKSDLLVYLVTGKEIFTPLFGNGACPYLAGERCLMAPAYRPFNCITFNCEIIEDLLPAEDRDRFYLLEREIRGIYRQIEELLPDGSLRGAVIDAPPEGAPPGAMQ